MVRSGGGKPPRRHQSPVGSGIKLVDRQHGKGARPARQRARHADKRGEGAVLLTHRRGPGGEVHVASNDQGVTFDPCQRARYIVSAHRLSARCRAGVVERNHGKRIAAGLRNPRPEHRGTEFAAPGILQEIVAVRDRPAREDREVAARRAFGRKGEMLAQRGEHRAEAAIHLLQHHDIGFRVDDRLRGIGGVAIALPDIMSEQPDWGRALLRGRNLARQLGHHANRDRRQADKGCDDSPAPARPGEQQSYQHRHAKYRQERRQYIKHRHEPAAERQPRGEVRPASQQGAESADRLHARASSRLRRA